MRCSRTVLPAVIAAGMAAMVTGAAATEYPVTLQFRENWGAPLAVRAGAFSGGLPLAPADPVGHLYQQRGAESFFYCDGDAVVDAPEGPLTIRAGRGFEYIPRDTTVVITAPTTVRVTLSRFIQMSGLGYYSGDTHVHIAHPPAIYPLGGKDLLLAAQAEDLNLINCMEERPFFTGVADPVSLPNRLVYFSKEQRNAHFSHLSVLGLKQWIVDQGCVEAGIACGRTIDASISAEVRAQPGETALIATHPFCTFDMDNISGWPGVGMWRGMAIDLAAGAVDAMDLINYSNAPPSQGVPPYFEVLNAGFRMPPSAGTDCVLGSGTSLPAGGYRVYVKHESYFDMNRWITGLKAGRSFVSNYPLFAYFEVEGRAPGDVVTGSGAMLHGSVFVTCALPLRNVEIYGDTGLLLRITAPGGSSRRISGTFDIQRTGLSWVVARATGYDTGWHAIGADGLFAQTAPVYVESNSANAALQGLNVTPHVTRVAAANYFLDQLDQFESVFDDDGYFPGNSRVAFDNAVAVARQFYTDLTGPSTGVATTPALRAWSLGMPRPNPFSGDVRVPYTVPAADASHTVDVFDAAGRAVRRLYAGSRAGGDYELSWDGRDDRGAPVPSGVYFVRVQPAGGASVARKIVRVR